MSHVLYGISFDGVAVSGITAEFIKLAGLFHRRGYAVHLDLGYDIKPDKGNFFHEYGPETRSIPRWIQLARTVDFKRIPGYGPRPADRLRDDDGGEPRRRPFELDVTAMIRRISAQIVATWRRLGVTLVVVENGTLPENVIYTRALYAAIAEYGHDYGRGAEAFVLWRDHDVMWFCEPGKYGPPPYRHVPRPRSSPHIRYAALTGPAAQSLSQWSGVAYAVLPNAFEFPEHREPRGMRDAFGIPAGAFLIARCSRVIPQKRIDREIRLLHTAGALATSRGWNRPLHLFITSSVDENPAETAALRALAESLGVARQVHFGNGLLPCDAPPERECFSVSDLLVESDLSSFLTSYRYEGFGNAPGEACAHRVPYVSARYELYDAVYGHLGLRALTLPLDANDEEPPEAWVAMFTERIVDGARLQADAAYNFERARRHLSMPRFAERLARLFPNLFADGVVRNVTAAERRVAS